MPPIPETTKPFFQEYDFKRLDPEHNGDLVIERLLAYGNRGEVRWLLQYYGRERVRHWLSTMGLRRLPKGRYRIWCVIMNVPEAAREHTPIWPY
jgi:hypothetical protein